MINESLLPLVKEEISASAPWLHVSAVANVWDFPGVEREACGGGVGGFFAFDFPALCYLWENRGFLFSF